MHIKRVLSCALAGLMTITSFNFNVMAAELQDTTDDDGGNIAIEELAETPEVEEEESEEDPASDDGGLVDVPTDDASVVDVELNNDEVLGTSGAEEEVEDVVEDDVLAEVVPVTATLTTTETLTLNNETGKYETTYTGSNITPTLVVEQGETPIEAATSTSAEAGKYNVVIKKGTDTVSNIKDAGTYTYTVTAGKALEDTLPDTEITLTLVVAPMELTVALGDDAADGGHENSVTVGGTVAPTYAYKLYYYTSAQVTSETSDTLKPVEGVTGRKVEPAITFKNSSTTVDLVKKSGETANDYDVVYSNNDAIGKATATITLTNTNYAFADSATSLTQEYTIEDGDEEEQVSDATWTALKDSDKAVISEVAENNKSGTLTTYGKDYHKKYTKEIPALKKIIIDGPKTEAGFESVTIDKIVDTDDEDITDYFTISKRQASEDSGTLVIKPTTSGEKIGTTRYTGTYNLTYEWATSADEHTWTRKQHPATFKKAGYYWYENEAGERAQAGQKIEVDGKEITVASETTTIAALGDQFENCFIINDKESNAVPFLYDNANLSVDYLGKALSIKKGLTVGTGNITEFAQENGKDTDVRQFTATLTGNTGVGTATLTIKMADDYDNGDYKGATLTKTFKVGKATEKVESPVLKKTKGTTASATKYGEKFELVSSTEGAKIYYQISKSDGLVDPTDLTDSGETKIPITVTATALEGITVEEYKDAIGFDSEYILAGNMMKIRAFAVKTVDGTAIYSAPADLVVSATTDALWGDVTPGIDGPATLPEIPEGLWISKDTLDDYLTDAKTPEMGGVDVDWDTTNKTATASIEYSGFAKTLRTGKDSSGTPYTDYYKVFYNNEELDYGTDYSISYKDNTNAGKAQMIITGKGKYADTYVQEFTIKPMSLGTVTGTVGAYVFTEENDGTTNTYPYRDLYVSPASEVGTDTFAVVVPDNGTIQNPKFTLSYTQLQYSGKSSKFVTKKLAEGKDFEVDYSAVRANVTGNDNPYAIKIKLIGNYTTTNTTAPLDESLTGYINDRNLYVVSSGRNIAKAKVDVDTKSVVLDGTDKKADVKTTVTLEGVTLLEGTDYDVAYSWNGLDVMDVFLPGEIRTVGSYTATITGKGDFAGQVTKTFAVPASAAKKINAKGITVTPAESSLPITSAGTQTFVVKDGEDVLTLNQDYVVVLPVAKVGKVKATIYGIGAYTGSINSQYTLEGAQPSVAITGASTNIYDGTDWSPAIKLTVANPLSDKEVIPTTINVDTRPSVVGVDVDGDGFGDERFDVIWPKDTKNVGKKQVTIKGRNGNNFKATLKYEITKYDISGLAGYNKIANPDGSAAINLIVDADADKNMPEVRYTGAAVQPAFNNNVPVDANLEYAKFIGQNFSFSYKKGYKAGSTVTVKVTGKKNFTGSVTGTYKIEQANIDTYATATVTDIVEGKQFKAPTVKVYDIANSKKTLSAGAKKDYTVKYLYASNTDAHNRYDEVNTKEKVVAGTEYIARIIGVNGYTGNKDVQFRAVASTFDIGKANVTVNRKFLFDGKEVKIDKNDISVVLNKVAVPSEGFEIVSYTYPRNKAGELIAGTGKVKLHGIATANAVYGGYKEVSFTIAKAPVDYAIQFKADRFGPDGELLTIGKTQNTMTNKVDGKFTLPKSGFTATRTVYNATTKKYETINYVLSYYIDENGAQYNGGAKIDLVEDFGKAKGETVTFTAKFEKASADPYTITFKAGKGGSPLVAASGNDKVVKVKRGDVYKLPKQGFKLDGYELIGYATAEGGAKVYDIGDSVSNLTAAKGNVNLFGYYKKVPQKYNISYKLDGGKITSKKADYSQTYDEETDGVLPTVEKKGYHLDPAGNWKVNGSVATKVDKALKKNVEATPVWKENQYTLKYDFNSTTATGTPTSAASKKYTDKIDIAAAPANSNTELTFLGWAKEKGSLKADYPAGKKNVQILADDSTTVTLYGVWKEQSYKLAYVIDKADKKLGAKITTPGDVTFTKAALDAAPATVKLATATLDGYDFQGWSLDGKTKKTDAEILTELKKVTDTKKATELTAIFKKDEAKVTVTYDTQVTSPEAYTIKFDEITRDGSIKAPSFDSTKAPLNKTFKEWTVLSGSTTKTAYAAGATIKFADASASTLALRADFEEAKGKISYTFGDAAIANGVSNATVEDFYWYDATTPRTLPVKAQIKEPDGYSFEGWYLSDDKDKTIVTTVSLAANGETVTGSDTKKIKDVKLTAKLDPKPVVITLKANGTLETADIGTDKWTDATGGTYTKTINVKTSSFTLPTPKAQDGKTFEGWALDENLDGVANADEVLSKTVTISGFTSNAQYAAKWSDIEYTVTLELNGCELDDDVIHKVANDGKWVLSSDKNTATKTYKLGQTVARPTPTTEIKKENYTVVIKEADGTTDAADIALTDHKNVTWKAVATENKKLTITFAAGDHGSGVMDAQAIYTTKKAKLTANGFTAASGYQFDGWKVTAVINLNGVTTSTTYANRAEVTATLTDGAKDATVTLTAQWKVAENIVSFKLNGTGATGTADDITVKYTDTAFTSVPANPTRTGYTFDGWTTKRDGSGTKVWFTAHGTVTEDNAKKAALDTLKSTSAKKTTLYAQWVALKRTISFDVNGGSGVISAKVYSYDDEEFALPASATGAKAPAGLTPPEGKKFSGWSLTTNGEVITNVTSISPAVSTDAITLHAIWVNE